MSKLLLVVGLVVTRRAVGGSVAAYLQSQEQRFTRLSSPSTLRTERGCMSARNHKHILLVHILGAAHEKPFRKTLNIFEREKVVRTWNEITDNLLKY